MVESSASEVGSPPAGIRSSGIAVQFVGGGRMGEAIIAGLIRSGELRAEEIAVVEALPARREQLRVTYPQLVLGDVPTAAPTVIAVKPDDVAAAVSKAVAAGVDTVLSVAAGVPLGRLEVAAGPGVAVVRAMPNTPALVGAGVIVDLGARIVRLDGEEISLRAKEFDLLELLVSRPGHLFPREEIVERVWHHRYTPASRSLDVHVRRLRAKLEQVSPGVTLQTVRGVGYRLGPEQGRRPIGGD